MDELNTPVFDFEEYIDEYFKPMQVTEKAKEERKEASRDLFDLLLLIFALISGGWASTEYIIDKFNYELRSIAMNYGDVDSYYDDYVDAAVNNIMTTTMAHVGSDYWVSPERAAEIAVNEANTILNYKELMDAKAMGYTSKTWKAEIDRRTRKEHIKMDGKTIPIDEWFVFSDCHVQMPRDEVNGTAKQVVNCRCVLKFGNATVFDDMTPKYEDVGVRISQNTSDPDLPYREVGLEEYQNFNVEATKPEALDTKFMFEDEIYTVDGHSVVYSPSKREIEVAQLLIDKLGGVVALNPKILFPQGKRVADYSFRGKRFDLKEISGSSSSILADRINPKKKKIQSENVVYDIKDDCKLSNSELDAQLEKLFSNKHLGFLDEVIVIRNNDIYRILKRQNSFRT